VQEALSEEEEEYEEEEDLTVYANAKEMNEALKQQNSKGKTQVEANSATSLLPVAITAITASILLI